jgi:hypothetical protein
MWLTGLGQHVAESQQLAWRAGERQWLLGQQWWATAGAEAAAGGHGWAAATAI